MTDTCPIVTIELSPQQAAVFHPLLERQADERRGLLLMSVAPDLLDGQAIFRLQAVFLAWPAARKVLKIIREGSSV